MAMPRRSASNSALEHVPLKLGHRRVDKAALKSAFTRVLRRAMGRVPTSGRAANTDRGVSGRVGTALDIGAQLQEPSGAFAHPTVIAIERNVLSKKSQTKSLKTICRMVDLSQMT